VRREAETDKSAGIPEAEPARHPIGDRGMGGRTLQAREGSRARHILREELIAFCEHPITALIDRLAAPTGAQADAEGVCPKNDASDTVPSQTTLSAERHRAKDAA
jgi:hypothetical protein